MDWSTFLPAAFLWSFWQNKLQWFEDLFPDYEWFWLQEIVLWFSGVAQVCPHSRKLLEEGGRSDRVVSSLVAGASPRTSQWHSASLTSSQPQCHSEQQWHSDPSTLPDTDNAPPNAFTAHHQCHSLECRCISSLLLVTNNYFSPPTFLLSLLLVTNNFC